MTAREPTETMGAYFTPDMGLGAAADALGLPPARGYTWAEWEAISAAGERYVARDVDVDVLDRRAEDRVVEVFGG